MFDALSAPWSLFAGEQAPDNPWQATGLEWQTSSPPPKENFRRPPWVDAEPYAYHELGRAPEVGPVAPVGTRGGLA